MVYMYFSKSLQGRKSAITVRPVSIELLFNPSMWTFMKKRCSRIKYNFVDFLYIVVVTQGFANLGKVLMSIKHFASFCTKLEILQK